MHEVQRRGALPGTTVRPSSLDEALTLLDRQGPRAKVIAGGTDLIPEFNRRQHDDIETLIDLSGVAGLSSIEVGERSAELGALVTHNQVAGHAELAKRALLLVQACQEIGSPQLRNRATIVGNLVTASPANDTITALRVLDAELVVRSFQDQRIIDLASFHTGVRSTLLQPNELVVAVRFRLLEEGESGVYVKAGNRVAQAISVVHAAMSVARGPDGVHARVALGSVAPTIVEFDLDAPTLDSDTVDRFARSVAADVAPIDDVRATGEYRTSIVETIVRRGLGALADDVADAHAVAPQLSNTGTAMKPGESATIGPTGEIRVTINGVDTQAIGSHLTLLDWLRDRAGPAAGMSLTGTKEGCAEGECGACTVVLNGAAVMSCLVPATAADGATVDTVEAIADGKSLDPVQEAFVKHGAVQCGYCIPGFIVAARALLDETPQPTNDEIVDALGGNLCRCTGYYTIIEAIASVGGER